MTLSKVHVDHLGTELPKRVLLVCNSTQVSGAEISLKLLVNNLNRKKYKPILLLPENVSLGYSIDKTTQVRFAPLIRFTRTINPLLLLKYFGNIFLTVKNILKIIRAENISLIHSNSTNAHIYGCLAGLIAGVPTIWHVRDYVSLGILGTLLEHFSTKIACVSKCVNGQKPFRYSKKAEVIYNGIDFAEWSPNSQVDLWNKLGLDQDVLLIAQIGQLGPWKRHRDFILTAERVVQRFKRVHFLIVGSDLFGENIQYIKELKQLILNKKMQPFFTFVKHHERVIDIMSRIDVLFHPAVHEAFGRVIVEAMALKKPVIAINSCGPQEIIDTNRTGYLVDPGDVDAMSRKLLMLLEDKALRNKLGEAGRKYVKSHFGLHRHVDRMETLFELALKK